MCVKRDCILLTKKYDNEVRFECRGLTELLCNNKQIERSGKGCPFYKSKSKYNNDGSVKVGGV